MFRVPSVRTARPGGRRAAAAVLAAGALLTTPACSDPVDIQETFAVAEFAGGYFDGGIVDGKNRLLPAATFRIENRTAESVGPFSVNVLFKQVSDDTEFDDVFLQRVEFTEGNRTREISARADTGITGDPPQSRADMLQRADFPDMRAVIYVKQSSSTWVEIARHDLPRQLIAR